MAEKQASQLSSEEQNFKEQLFGHSHLIQNNEDLNYSSLKLSCNMLCTSKKDITVSTNNE